MLDKAAEYLKENCCGSFREVQSYATCWALATIFGHWVILDSTLGRRRRKADQHILATQTVAEPICASSSNPYIEEKIQDKISFLSEG